MIAYFSQQQAVERLQQELVAGTVFPDFETVDTNGNPLALADFRGKVVLLDFWATWCMPCLSELPNLKETYDLHQAEGFEIIGISLDRDRGTLLKFMERQDMTWPQYFDGKAWETELALRFGVTSIPATFLLDRDGTIIARDLRGPALGRAVAAALEE